MTDATMAPTSPQQDWMTPAEFRTWFERLGISQAELGRRLEVKQATISRWLLDDPKKGRKIEHGEMLRRALEHLAAELEQERKPKRRRARPAPGDAGQEDAP